MFNSKIDTKYFKEKLERELAELENELKTVGRRNPDNPADWEAVPKKMDTLAADEGDVAENIEAYEENTAILKQLEIRWNEVRTALQRINENKYGLCETDGKPIELERLEANPAATTCVKHTK